MIECLEFIFGSFWRWLGSVILILAIAECFKGAIRITMRKNDE